MVSVTSDAEGLSGYIDLPVDSIWFISYKRIIDRLVVHTEDNKYYMTGPLKYCMNALNKSSNFVYADRSNIFNADNVVKINTLFKEVYFEEEITKKSKRCEIAHNRYDEAINRLEVLNPNVVFF
ncbi:LytTR family transcriptional regulator DNA-binding domain-containing protein [Paenibacillus polymyxa]|uniref:LytTR family transcriptional regulator DNA-binding domain-containing protein n=1 Tax=Paenibacillus polymyxa TaxID=1406 RepID=UPI000737AD25|nr:LytTR family transcriptional regulator DNA-binding domain-containing protein [Paenibacillus polymyxa]